MTAMCERFDNNLALRCALGAAMAVVLWGCQSPQPPTAPAPSPTVQIWSQPADLELPPIDGQLPELVAEAEPPASPDGVFLPSASQADVRAHFHKALGVLVVELELKPIVLDFDPVDEVLAIATFQPKASEPPYKWMLLLDRRADGRYEVLKRWAQPGTDAAYRLLSHSKGGRPLLMVERQGPEVSMVEAFSLEPGGKLTDRIRLGGAPSLYGKVSLAQPKGKGLRIVRSPAAKDTTGLPTSWRLVTTVKSFAAVEDKAQ